MGARQLREVFAVENTSAQILQTFAGIFVADYLIGFDQNMPGQSLLDFVGLLLSAFVHQFDEMETTGAAQWLADIANLHILNNPAEKSWHLIGLAPAEIAAFERLRAIRVANGDAGKIFPLQDALA